MSYQIIFATGAASGTQVTTEDNVPVPWRQMADQLLSLEDGWDAMGEGSAIKCSTVDNAINVMYLLRDRGFEDFRMQPGSAGEVLIICDLEARSAEVVVMSDNEYELYFEEDGEGIYENASLSFNELQREIATQCNTLEFSAPSITTERRVGLPEWRSDPHLTAASRSSMLSARYQAAGQFASIFKPITVS